MELQKHEEVKTTTQYWGYRELSANELLDVGGGGDFSGDGFGDGAGYGANGYAALAGAATANQDCIAGNNLQIVGLLQTMTQPGGVALAGATAYGAWCSNYDGNN